MSQETKKVIFLDRDGVINRERGEYTFKVEDVAWVEGLFEALQCFYENGFEFVVISNQGGVAKGLYDLNDVLAINTLFTNELERKGMKLLDHFYCPHHQDYSKCLCRKPESNMLERAVAKHNISIKDSYFIGDSERDVIAGEAIGINSIKVQANHSILELAKTLCYE